MTQTKLIRHGMGRIAPPPAGTTQETITDPLLIKSLLIAKLSEEGQEVATARTRDELLGELGDLYEILHALATMHKYAMHEVEAAAWAKAEERGPLLMTGGHGGPVALLHKVSLP